MSLAIVEIMIHADQGEITIREYEDKVRETLNQGGIKIEEDTR